MKLSSISSDVKKKNFMFAVNNLSINWFIRNLIWQNILSVHTSQCSGILCQNTIILLSFGFLLPLWATCWYFFQKWTYKYLSLGSSNIKRQKIWYKWYSWADFFNASRQNFVRKCQISGSKKPNDNKLMEFWRRIPEHCPWAWTQIKLLFCMFIPKDWCWKFATHKCSF